MVQVDVEGRKEEKFWGGTKGAHEVRYRVVLDAEEKRSAGERTLKRDVRYGTGWC